MHGRNTGARTHYFVLVQPTEEHVSATKGTPDAPLRCAGEPKTADARYHEGKFRPAVGVLPSSLAAQAPAAEHDITVSRTRFLLNGRPFSWTGVSFFNAIYHPTFNASVLSLLAPGTQCAYWDEARMVFGRTLTRAAHRDVIEGLRERVCHPVAWTGNHGYDDADVYCLGAPVK